MKSKSHESGHLGVDDVVSERRDATTGPRGGTTTVTRSGLVKKNFWIPAKEAERLRRVAYTAHISEAEVMREGLGLALDQWESRKPDSRGGQDG